MFLSWILLAAATTFGEPAPAGPAPVAPPAPEAPAPDPAADQPPSPGVTKTPGTGTGPADSNAAKVDLIPKYQPGDVIKLRWRQEGKDVHEGEKVLENQRSSWNNLEMEMSVTVLRVLPPTAEIPGLTYHCKMEIERVIIDAPAFNGREHYDSKDPKTSKSFFAAPAQIFLKSPVEFGFSEETYSYARKEHPRLRVWYADGTNLYDNVVGNDAFPARFGPLFGWLIDSASVGQSWGDVCPIRVNNGATILTRRDSTLVSNDGIQMEIAIKGTGESCPATGKRNLTFKNSTYEAKYKVNNASARLRSGEIVHKYSFDYDWKGKPATVTSTITETLERLD